MNNIYEQLIMHEGMKLEPYEDTVGKLTIGVGRNLEDKGITEEEAKELLKNDVLEITKKLERYDWFYKLDRVRQKVIIDMAFNLGINGLLSFKNMIAAINKEDYEKASEEMINSKWATQVKTRADRLARMMKSGKDYA